jgi:prepilin-type processing-associated H-X9-DG protein
LTPLQIIERLDNDFRWTSFAEADIRAMIQYLIEDYRTIDSFYWPLGSTNPIVDSLTITGTGGGDTVMRIKEGVERFMITDINNPAASAMAQSEIPVMWDQAMTGSGSTPYILAKLKFNHPPGGSNVLYMDGHVELHKFPDGSSDRAVPTGRMTVMIGSLW